MNKDRLTYAVVTGRQTTRVFKAYKKFCTQNNLPMVLLKNGRRFCKVEYWDNMNSHGVRTSITLRLQGLATTLGWEKSDKNGLDYRGTEIEDEFGFILRIPLKDGPVVAGMICEILAENMK